MSPPSSDRIDLLWAGTLIAEHKSRGKPLDKESREAEILVEEVV